MNISITRNPIAFQPIKLEIELNSLEEVAVFHAIFNYPPICERLEAANMDTETIRGCLTRLTGTTESDFIMRNTFEKIFTNKRE